MRFAIILLIVLAACHGAEINALAKAQNAISNPELFKGQEITIEAYTYTPLEACQASSGRCWGNVRIFANPYDEKQDSLLLINGDAMNEANSYGIYQCVDKETSECKGWKDNQKYLLRGKIEQDPNPYVTEEKLVFVYLEKEEI